jgi:hypothetical protein
LERHFHLLQEEKNRIEAEAKGKENAKARKHENLKEEIQRLHLLLDSSERDLNDKFADLSRYRALVENKSVDSARLRKVVADLDEEGIRIQRTKLLLQQELQAAHNDRRVSEQAANKRMEDGEVLKRAKKSEEDRLHDLLVTVDQYKRILSQKQEAADLIERQCDQKDKEVIDMIQVKKQVQDEAASISIENERLQEEKENLLKKVKELELQSRLANKKLDDINELISNKDKEIRSIKSESTYAESKESSIKQELRKLQTENESFQILLDRYRNNAQVQKRLRDEESLKKYRLEEEKERLAREALTKEIEAKNARRELERYKGSHNQLLEEHAMVSHELEAVKEHANLLESQNMNLSRELDSFVYTNERAREDLDRRNRVECIKSKNMSMLERSAEKVRNSRSPRRSPYKSPIRSPY